MADPKLSLPYDEAFGRLNAEHEPWLEAVYVPPPDFSALAAPRSSLVLGEKGSGKTALLQAVRRELTQQRVLVVDWTWDPLAWMGKQGLAALDALLAHLMQHIARSFCLAIVSQPDRWASLIPTSQSLLHGFLYRHLGPRLDLLAVQEQASPDRSPALLEQLSREPVIRLPDSMSPVMALGYLVPLVQQAQYSAVGVLVDDVAPWIAVDPGTVSPVLQLFLSTLAIFDVRSLFFKMVLDDGLADLVHSSGAVVRRRAERLNLRWTPEGLEQVVTSRLQAVLGEKGHLGNLYDRRSLMSWLERAGGKTPGSWLMLSAAVVRRVLISQQEEGQIRPLNDQEWEDLRGQYSLDLSYDPQTHKVAVGPRQVTLSESEEIIFRYLFRRRGEVCSLDELYRIYEREIHPQTQLDEDRVNYRGRLDTLLYRLRQAIEPDPWHPLLFITHRGRGISLE